MVADYSHGLPPPPNLRTFCSKQREIKDKNNENMDYTLNNWVRKIGPILEGLAEK